MTILTPSTGATREGPLLRLNTRGLVAGERALFRGYSGWTVAPIGAPMDKSIRIGSEVLMYRQVAGVIPTSMDAMREAELVAALQHADARRVELIRRANDAHRDRVAAILDAAALDKQGPPPPVG